MKKQKLTKVHLTDNSFDNLRAMRKSISPSADFRKSIRRQYSLYVLSEPTKGCQTLLLNIVFFQLLLIIGAIVFHIYYPTIISQPCFVLLNVPVIFFPPCHVPSKISPFIFTSFPKPFL